MDVFASFGDAFTTVISGGFDRITPYALTLAYGLSTMGIIGLGFSVAFGSGASVGAARLGVIGGFYLIVIKNIMPIGSGILEGAAQFGLIAGGSSMNGDVFLRSPDTIFSIGYARMLDLFEMADASCAANWIPGPCLNTNYFALSGAGATVLVVFAVVAGVVLGTFILFKILMVASLVMLPFAIFSPTAGYGIAPVRGAVHAAVQIMALALVLSVGNMVFGKLMVDHNNGAITTAVPFFVASLFLVGLTMGAMKLAHSLTSGAMLSAGSLFGAPAGMTIAGARSAAGYLDAPATSGIRKAHGMLKEAAGYSGSSSQTTKTGSSSASGGGTASSISAAASSSTYGKKPSDGGFSRSRPEVARGQSTRGSSVA